MKGGTLFSGVGAPELAAPDIDWRWCALGNAMAVPVIRWILSRIKDTSMFAELVAD